MAREKNRKVKKTMKPEEKKKLRLKVLKIGILAALLFLINAYIILGYLYKKGDFTISLDSQNEEKPNLIIYESPLDKTQKNYLRCDDVRFISDISVNWLPQDINNEADGSHNGNEYIAYTFYTENIGEKKVNYWTSVEIDWQEKEVDEALRFLLYKNGEKVLYAKRASNGQPEPGTVPFKSENLIMQDHRIGIEPGEIDKYTFVVFLEGSDPQCIDNILEGEISMFMKITEEYIQDEVK